MKTVKQATRGQELIHKENNETLMYYGISSVVGITAFLIVYNFVFGCSLTAWTGFAISVFMELAALGLMKIGTKCVLGQRGQVIDAGVDLNDPQGSGEYCKDVIILCILSQLLSLITLYGLLLLVAFPSYGAYKLWVLVIAPWIFAEPEEEDPQDEKRNRRKQRVVYRR